MTGASEQSGRSKQVLSYNAWPLENSEKVTGSSTSGESYTRESSHIKLHDIVTLNIRTEYELVGAVNLES